MVCQDTVKRKQPTTKKHYDKKDIIIQNHGEKNIFEHLKHF
jgi:hypothetical protein